MYGNTGNRMGFNPEQLRQLLKDIATAYGHETASMDGLFYCFQSSILGQDYGDMTGRSTGGWYAPEAKEFCEKVLTPVMQKQFKQIKNVYLSLYDAVRLAGINWNRTTGSNEFFPEWPIGGINEPDFDDAIISVPDSKNGVTGIDPNIASQLTESFSKCKRYHADMYSPIFKKIIQTSAFLGGTQQSELVTRINNVHTATIAEVNTVFDIAIKRIQEAVEKYQQTAQAVSTSFNAQ